MERIRSKKGLKRLERKAAREGRLGGSIRATLKYECAVTELLSRIVWEDYKGHEDSTRICQQ